MRQNIISVRFKNIRSFRDENTVSFLADSKYHSKNDAPEKWNLIEYESLGKEKILPVVGLYGHNASGKSNFLKFVLDLKLLLERRTSKDLIKVDPFLADDVSKNKVSMIGIEAVIDDYYFDWGVEFLPTKNEIVREELTVSRNGKRKKYVKNQTAFKASDDFVPESAKKEITELKGRKDLSVLEILHLRGLRPFTDLYVFLHGLFDFVNLQKKYEQLYVDDAERRKIAAAISEIDVGVTDIKIEKFEIPPSAPERIKTLLSEYATGIFYRPFFIHAGRYLLPESQGTSSYFNIMLLVADLFANGGIVVIDEIERSLHPMLLRKIFKMFHDKNINKAGAQLLFSSHDVSVLKPDVFRRDEIYFTEKENDGSSSVYSMNAFRGLRGHEDYGEYYLKGYFGAVPVFRG